MQPAMDHAEMTALLRDMIVEWRKEFQASVNELAEGDYLQFTCEMWLPSGIRASPTKEHHKKVKVISEPYFPFLDMKMIWSEHGDLQFQVHMKENQRLKCLNKGSDHTDHCFNAIPSEVQGSLAKLTAMTDDDNADKQLNELYPYHFQALEKAELVDQQVPTLKLEKSRLEASKEAS